MHLAGVLLVAGLKPGAPGQGGVAELPGDVGDLPELAPARDAHVRVDLNAAPAEVAARLLIVMQVPVHQIGHLGQERALKVAELPSAALLRGDAVPVACRVVGLRERLERLPVGAPGVLVGDLPPVAWVNEDTEAELDVQINNRGPLQTAEAECPPVGVASAAPALRVTSVLVPRKVALPYGEVPTVLHRPVADHEVVDTHRK